MYGMRFHVAPPSWSCGCPDLFDSVFCASSLESSGDSHGPVTGALSLGYELKGRKEEDEKKATIFTGREFYRCPRYAPPPPPKVLDSHWVDTTRQNSQLTSTEKSAVCTVCRRGP